MNDKAGTNASGAEPYKIQMLGTRFAFLSEPKKSSDGTYKINTSEVKTLTSRDKISARGLYNDNINEKASHTLIYATNQLPIIDEYDIGIWRRIELIKFRIQFLPQQEYEKTINTYIKNQRKKGIKESIINEELENLNKKIMDENVGKYITDENVKECFLSLLIDRYIKYKYCKCNNCKCVLNICSECKDCEHLNKICSKCKEEIKEGDNQSISSCCNSIIICYDCFNCNCRTCGICGSKRCEKCYNDKYKCHLCKKCNSCEKFALIPKTLLEYNNNFKENSDNIQTFINNKLTKEGATDMDEISISEIYNTYKSFCQKNQFETKNASNFKDHFGKLMTNVYYNKNTSKLKGYKFIE